MPRLKKEVVERREALAWRLFREGKDIEHVQDVLHREDGMKMSPGRLQEILAEALMGPLPKENLPTEEAGPEPQEETEEKDVEEEPVEETRESLEQDRVELDPHLQVIMDRPRNRSEIDWNSPDVKAACRLQEEELRRTGKLRIIDV